MDYKKIYLKKLSYYYLIKEIGEGASSTVYLSVDGKKDELVALKSIPLSKIKKEDNGILKLQREITILHKLQHDNIVKIRNQLSTKNNYYLAIEYCNGGTLEDYKNYYEQKLKMTLNELFIQKIMRQVTDGLEYMHSKNIVHRDIKLDNILLNFNKYSNYVIKGQLPPKVNYDNVTLNDSFTIKIADLGYSKELTDSDAGKSILGTPINMSPDIVGNIEGEQKKYNTSVDLWSLGTIVYQLLTGKMPFIGKDSKEIFKHIMEGKYSLPSYLVVSVEVLTFINGLLQFYPEKRLTWKQIKSHPFLTKNIESFTFIKLNTLKESDKKEIELNSKDADNLLWILFKNKGLNINLDKININAIKNKELKQSINDNVVNNEEIKKAIEIEKKKIEEEKKRLMKEKNDAEKLKKEAEDLKKEANLIKEKNEKEKEKLNEEEKKRKELEEKLKKDGKINQQKEEEIKKQIDVYQKKIKEMEKNKNENDKKLQDAEKLLKNAEKMRKDAVAQMENLNKKREIEEKIRKDEEIKLKEKEKQLLDDKNKLEKELEKIKEDQKKKEENYKEEKEQLNKQIEEMNKLKSDLEKEVDKNKETENELKKKEYAIQEYKNKIKNLNEAKNKEIEKYENEKKELEELQEKVKYKVENLKLDLLEQENEEKNKEKNKEKKEKKENEELEDKDDFELDDEGNVIIANKEKKDDDYDDWEICEGEEVMSINMDNEKYQDDFLKDFEIIDNYDDNNQEITKSKKIEI
jgi:serine/threonine protein kinase